MSRRSLGISLTGHAILAGVCIFGLPFLNTTVQPPPTPIPIEIVDIASVTTTPRPSRPAAEIKQPIPPTPIPPPRPVPAPERPSVEAPTPPPPSPKIPPPRPKEDDTPVKPSVKQAAQPTEEGTQRVDNKKPPLQPKEPPKSVAPQENPQDDISSILKGLKDVKPTPRPNFAPTTPTATTSTPTPSTLDSPFASDKLTVSELDALKQQLRSCWSFPVGAKDAHNLVVDIQVDVNPDRTVRSAEIADTARSQSDPFFRSAAEAARRAVLKCQPLRLPQDKYDMWQKITIQFDPRDFL